MQNFMKIDKAVATDPQSKIAEATWTLLDWHSVLVLVFCLLVLVWFVWF